MNRIYSQTQSWPGLDLGVIKLKWPGLARIPLHSYERVWAKALPFPSCVAW